MVQLPSGVVSFLFTDIEGSTRLFHELGDAYRVLLSEHNELLRRVWSLHDGFEIKTEGDAFFVAFESPVDALEAAVEVQDAIHGQAWSSAVPRVRVGVHSGLAAPVDGDYVALAVHQAARVVGAANGGQVLATSATVDLASGKATVDVTAIGRYRLRGFDEPTHLYEVSAAGARLESLPVRATPSEGHNIAVPLTSFVGRDSELADIALLLDEHRLVTIVGSGGVGKTRVAREIGTSLSRSFGGGVWLVDLSPAEPSASVPSLVASTMGVQADGRDPLEVIAECIGRDRVLLILDTCEHVVDQVRQLVGAVLQAAPNLVILATTRVALELNYEIVRTLMPLPIAAAEQLFIERLGQSENEGIRRVVTEICAKLEGVPLALELAAARSRSSSLEAVLSMLDDPARMMRVKQRGADQRQASLEAVVDWSFQLLEPVEKAVFLRLGAFSSSFSEISGAWAAADGTYESYEVAEAIWALADYSLLERVTEDSETRYRMLETIRAYAREHVGPTEAIAVSTRLAAELLDRIGPGVPSNSETVALRRLEIDNVRGIIPVLNDEEPELAQLLALTILGSANDEADDFSYQHEADAFVSDLQAWTPARAQLLAMTAQLHHHVGDFSTEELLDDAERVNAAVGHEPDWANGRIGVIRCEWLARTGRSDEAIAMARDALEQVLPDRERSVWLEQYGILLVEDEPALAIRSLEEGLALLPSDHLFRIALFHSNIAEALMRLDRHAEAATHQAEALRVGAQLGMPILVAASLVVAARLSALSAAWDTAIRLHGAADRILDQSGAALFPDDVELSERMLAKARQQLPNEYDALRDGGYRLETSDAAAEALAVLTSQ